MSSLYSVIRKLNFTDLSTPAALRKAQIAVRMIGAPEIGAASRWAAAGGFFLYWMIEDRTASADNS